MARPTTKKDLMIASQENYDKLISLLESFTKEQLSADFTFDWKKEKEAHWARDKNIRDVIIHLYEWHKLLLEWVRTNQNGKEAQFLKEGYNWKSYGQMNVEIWESHQETTVEEALELFKKSHSDIMELAEELSSDELFSKNVFPWVGGTTLGSYFVSATASHYTWAAKKVRKHKKSL